MRTGSKGGRPPAPGPRTQAHFWMRVEVKAAAEKAAASTGMTLTDYMSQLVVQATGIAVPDELQEALPFAEAAA